MARLYFFGGGGGAGGFGGREFPPPPPFFPPVPCPFFAFPHTSRCFIAILHLLKLSFLVPAES